MSDINVLQFVIALITTFVIALIVSFIRNKPSLGLAFSSLGLFIGLLVGLSASPIVAGLVAAGFVLAGQLIKILPTQNPPSSDSTGTDIAWLPPLAVFACIGLLSGLIFRVNNTFSLHNSNLRSSFWELGFNQPQVDMIMERVAKNAKIDLPANRTSSETQSGTFLLSGSLGSDSGQTRADRWDFLTKSGFTNEQIISYLVKHGSSDEISSIRSMQSDKKTSAQIVEELRRRATQ
jgi:hypothetical protein